MRQIGNAGNSPPQSQAAPPSRTTAHQAVKIAIAASKMTAAERCFRAIEELIIAAAVVRTIGAAGKIFGAAMIAKSRWQGFRILPIHENGGIRRWPNLERRRCADRRSNKINQQRQDNRLRHVSVIAIDSLSDQFITAADPRGRRMVKHAPSPSLLSTSTRPWCSS